MENPERSSEELPPAVGEYESVTDLPETYEIEWALTDGGVDDQYLAEFVGLVDDYLASGVGEKLAVVIRELFLLSSQLGHTSFDTLGQHPDLATFVLVVRSGSGPSLDELADLADIRPEVEHSLRAARSEALERIAHHHTK